VEQIGTGEHALRHLSRYVYRVALTNHRIERFGHARVTFNYTHARSGETRRVTLPVHAFLARVLQHVLPPRLRQAQLHAAVRANHLRPALGTLIRRPASHFDAVEIPRTTLSIGELSSTPDFAAASRGKNLYFVRKQLKQQCRSASAS
jgi:hypothetical protein